MSDTNLVQSCPCGSENPIESCCLPLIQGKKEAQTAEELLRARYTAFTRGDVSFILNSHHSKTRGDIKEEEVREWSKNSEWLGLEIVQIEAGKPSDSQATIIFNAKFREKDSSKAKNSAPVQDHWEKSFFEKENGHWRFLDAQGVHTGTYKREQPKVGRNDICPCGSGKKFKKCCGK